MRPVRVPSATYRIQFTPGFRFDDARRLVPYLDALGITDLYASPVFAARRGSTHGYDVVDLRCVNPELGGEDGLRELAGALRERGMGLLCDIVPNHMAASSENPWWSDVLRHGVDSPYSTYFDIDWHPLTPGLKNKVLLPILAAPYGQVLENQEIRLVFTEDGLEARYHEERLPLSHQSQREILGGILGEFEAQGGAEEGGEGANGKTAEQVALEEGWEQVGGKAAETVAARVRRGTRCARGDEGEARLWRLYNENADVEARIHGVLSALNGVKGDPRSFDRLHRILEQQAYQLAFWKVANDEINYRRFFDTSDLVCVRVEDRRVFEDTHRLIVDLVREGLITGLRIDHVDGLWDPEAYLRLLQGWLQDQGEGGRGGQGGRSGKGCRDGGDGLGSEDGEGCGFYVVVEKILTGDEELPEGWPVHGTTGYDFLRTVNGLLVDVRGASGLDRLYARLAESNLDFERLVYEQKLRVMADLFAGEMRSLAWRLLRLAERDRYARDLSLSEIEEALQEVTAAMPVYRTYTRSLEVAERDRAYVEQAVDAAERRGRAEPRAREFVRRVLLLEFPDHAGARERDEWLRFVMRWQQFTGPIMAKGFEDTTLYIYNRLVSLNEVGGEPESTGVSVVEFHRRNLVRRERWPHTMNTTSTHDTKRSEDVRARINVLSEIPDLWAQRLERWREWNMPKLAVANGEPVPDPNFEMLVYETLVGAWPLRKEEEPEFRERLEAYLVKAAREAKVYTSWLAPDSAYEEALIGFARSILEPSGENRFLEDFLRFQGCVAYYGALGSLVQVLLKIASPGIPDFYQGMELWNFSLVDPDNRRPVDFERRALLLAELQRRERAREAERHGERKGERKGEREGEGERGAEREGQRGVERKPESRAGGAAMGGACRLARELLSSWEDGRIKLYVTYKALHYRRDHRELFESGDYVPLDAVGPQRDHVCAFARRLGGLWAIVAVPRLVARLQAEGGRGAPGTRGYHGSGGGIPAHRGWRAGQGPEPQPQLQLQAQSRQQSHSRLQSRRLPPSRLRSQPRPQWQPHPRPDAWTGPESDLPELRPPLGEATWGETALVLPDGTPAEWRNVLTGEILPGPNAGADAPDGIPRQAQAAPAAANLLRLADAFREFPVVLLAGER